MNQSIESITNDCIETIIALTLTRFYIDDIKSRVDTYFYAIRNDKNDRAKCRAQMQSNATTFVYVETTNES